MPLQQFIDKLATKYANILRKDKPFLDGEVNQLFGSRYRFSEEDFAKVYASLSSNQTVCAVLRVGCEVKREKKAMDVTKVL